MTAAAPLLPSFDTMVTNTLPGTQNKRVSAPALVCPSLATDLLAECKYDVDRSIQSEACIHTRVMYNKYTRLVYVENSADPDKTRSLAIGDTKHRELRRLVSCFNMACKACTAEKDKDLVEHTYLCRRCYEVFSRRTSSPITPLLCEGCLYDVHYHTLVLRDGSTRPGAPIPDLVYCCPSCGRRVRRTNRDRTNKRFMCNRCLLQQSHTSE